MEYLTQGENKGPRVALETLGCKLNQAETEQLSRQLIQAGCCIVQPGEKADIFILNSCTVTHIADRKSRHWLRMARRLNPAAFIIAAGCYAQRDTAGLARMEGVDLVLGNEEKAGIIKTLEKLGYLKSSGLNPVSSQLSRTRSFIKIQDGCNNYCAYCIVPLVRGREKSQPPDQVIAEIRQRNSEGYREVVLTGTEIGRYQWEGLDLAGLLERILAQTEIGRLRLSSLQPQEISPGLLRLWQDARLCPHFHISLQSGSNSVLRRMGRRYTGGEYAAAIDNIRSAVPEAAITTDIIAGFPGETQDEHRESCEFCAQRQFARIHVFPFSAREGTRAASLSEQIPFQVKKQRSDELLALSRSSLQDFNRRFIGQTRIVLFEQPDAGLWSGLTDNYIKVYTRSDANLTNRLLAVKLEDLRGDGMRGSLTDLFITHT
jgi:threonylcarbamoyladenosine tRNA methylthiotransferase MtaB